MSSRVLSLVAASVLSFAQTAPTTSLTGTLADASSAAIAKAAIELTNTATHFTKRAASDSQGRFLFNLIPPGVYDLTVSASGFTTVTQQGITLDVDVPAAVRLKLAVAGSAQQITVSADAPMVDSESGALRQVVSERYIQELPLNGRNAATLVFMPPGTVTAK